MTPREIWMISPTQIVCIGMGIILLSLIVWIHTLRGILGGQHIYKDLAQLEDGPLTRSRANKTKEAMGLFVQVT